MSDSCGSSSAMDAGSLNRFNLTDKTPLFQPRVQLQF
jgi:hypothetical protein